MQRGLIWVCIGRQGRPIDNGFLSFDVGDQRDGLREVLPLASVALPWRHSFDRFPGDDSLLRQWISDGFCSWLLLELSGTVSVARDDLGWPDGGPKVEYLLLFSASLLRQEFSGLFPSYEGLPQRGGKALVDKGMFRLQSCHLAGSVMVLVGRQKAPKSASFTYFLL